MSIIVDATGPEEQARNLSAYHEATFMITAGIDRC
jgi:hypothetical protein